jgi:acetyl-CoA carboxylase biotin carboxyl carrier protein
VKDSNYINEIEKLSKVMDANNLMSVHYNEGTFSINITKNTMYGGMSQSFSVPVYANDTVNTHMQDFGTVSENATGEATVPSAGAFEVKSPMVGVFFNAPSPDAEPFVRIGDSVKKGDVLCILEAMKLMNEIPAEIEGTVTDICVKNGDVVEFGQVLFKIEN